MNIVDFHDLGIAPYKETWELQAAIQKKLIEEKLAERGGSLNKPRSNDVLLMVEHSHVFTLGKSGNIGHLLKSDKELTDLNAEFVQIDRGGDITYHGPGQLVVYPIMDLSRYFTDIHRYLRCLEEIVIQTCADYNIQAGRIKNMTGVWIDGAKVAAFGIRCSRWVTMHGLALNVNPDLGYFNHIVPCGITDKKVTSLKELVGRPLNMSEVKSRIQKNYENVFNVTLQKGKALNETLIPR